jgi:hypothetical protein
MIDLYRHPAKRASMIANAAEDYVPYRWEIEAKRYQLLLATLCQKQKKIEDQRSVVHSEM